MSDASNLPQSSSDVVIAPTIFNTTKTDYEKPPLFLGQPMGLFDSVNKNYPKIFQRYKKLKSLDWDENEFPFASCNQEFKTASRNDYDMMIRTLAWQWEADTVAARHIAPVVAPFVTSTELWTAWLRVSDNEALHALTYSEIVRNSFDNPQEVFEEILKVQESFQRLSTVAKVMEETYVMSHKLALGMVDRDAQSTYEQIFKFVVALWCLERIQFMSSFAVTFSFADDGMYLPIGKAVQKICQDEFEIHQRLDKDILDYEITTTRGYLAYTNQRHVIQSMIDEVVSSELTWLETYLYANGRTRPNLSLADAKAWTLFNAKPVYEYFYLDCPAHLGQLPEKNPIEWINEWIDIGRIQGAAQEEKLGGYFLGGFTHDDTGAKRSIEGLI